jgi:hypothetical protein
MALSATSSYGTTKMQLAADVLNAGTVTVAYPTGTVQADYTSGNAGVTSDNMAIIGGTKYTGASALGYVYGVSNITVTNNTGVTWTANSECYFGFPKADPTLKYNGAKAVL